MDNEKLEYLYEYNQLTLVDNPKSICQTCSKIGNCTNHHKCKNFYDDITPKVNIFIDKFRTREIHQIEYEKLKRTEYFYETFKKICASNTPAGEEVDMCVEDFFDLEHQIFCHSGKDRDSCGRCFLKHLKLWEQEKIKLREVEEE